MTVGYPMILMNAVLGVATFRRGPLDPVDQDPDTVRDQACELVASDRVCRPPTPRPIDSDASSGGSGWLNLSFLTVIFWLVLVAVVAYLVFLAIGLLVERSPSARAKKSATSDRAPADVEALTAVIVDRSREPKDWRREADEHRRLGRFRDALRCRYRALVGDLARLGWIDEIPGRTTGEERVQLDVVCPPATESFGQAADLFDEAWYGNANVADADVAEFEQLESLVLAQTGGRR